MRQNTNQLTITPCNRVLPQKLTGPQLLKKFPAFYVTRRFIAVSTSSRHLSLSWAREIQPPHPTSWRSILILSSHLRIGLPNGLFPSGLPTIILYAHFLSLIRATYPAHLIVFDFITQIIPGEQYRSLSCPLRSLLPSPVTASVLAPNIFLSTIFSDTLILCPFLNERHQVSHPYKRGNITVMYV